MTDSKPRRVWPLVFLVACVVVCCAGAITWLGRVEGPERKTNRADLTAGPAPTPTTLLFYDPVHIGDPIEGRPWISHVTVVDLDADGLLDVVACDALTNTIRWLRQSPVGVYTESRIGDAVRGPARIEPCDIDRDGDLDLLVASMGVIMPSNDPIGAVVVLENLGDGTFRNRTLVEGIARVSDVRGADLDDDGDIDLVVGQFGYAQGEVRWMRNDGDWRFTSQRLLGLSGTIHTPVADLDGDGRPDVVALVSQEWEEIHLFRNRGASGFRGSVVWGSTNEDYGSSGLELADVDRDGDLDLIYTNGDAFDYARPGPRPWHGIQWLENRSGVFTFHRVGLFPGAYAPVCADFDGDGTMDLAAVSGFNNWDDPGAHSLMLWLNDGRQRFTAVPIASRPTHLITLAAADMDGDGTVELITGGFHAYPPWGHLSRITLWKRR
ncbi:hypothetical protein ASA1KI_45900 [Opitutales bacterium ASA1]|uniref:FG-GAP repeat domain-containing protein n=1 Tax=Congregicoccus parvus TaxID=3081749 RepID=UPI002B322452|nr:hypothetical protein ASA1KI_45900 [Opitutales bacterium ASA1]